MVATRWFNQGKNVSNVPCRDSCAEGSYRLRIAPTLDPGPPRGFADRNYRGNRRIGLRVADDLQKPGIAGEREVEENRKINEARKWRKV